MGGGGYSGLPGMTRGTEHSLLKSSVDLIGHISGATVTPGDQHRPTSQQHCILVMDWGSWLEQRPFVRAV